MKPKRAAVLVILSILVPGISLAQQTSSESELKLLAIPTPELGELEPVVADQLLQLQQLVQELAQRGIDRAELAEAYGELAQTYHAYELAEPALVCYMNASRLAPNEFRWFYLGGVVAQSVGRLDQAQIAYQRALGLEPENLAAMVHLGESYLASNQADSARDVLEQALEVDPSSAAAQATLGQVALSQQKYDEAVRYFEAALKAVPEANRLHYPLGLAYRGMGELDKARLHFSQRGLVGVRPVDPLIDALAERKQGERVHLLRGRMAYSAGRYADAVASFRSAVEAEPESVRARVNLASAMAQAGAVDQAIEEFRNVLELDDANTTAHFNLGTLFLWKGDAEGALTHLRRARELDPQNGQTVFEMAKALQMSGQTEEALAAYAQVVEMQPLSEDARLGEVDLLVDLGRYQEARERLEDAHGLLPEMGRTAHALARLLAACPELSLRDGERALDLAQRVFAASRSASAAETVALALAELGRCEEAADWQRRLLEEITEDPEAAAPASMEAALERYVEGPPCRP